MDIIYGQSLVKGGSTSVKPLGTDKNVNSSL